MKQYFDIDKNQLVNPPGQGGVVRSVSWIRGDIDNLEMVFLKAGAAVTDVTNIVAVIKEKPGELEPSLATCQTWEEEDGVFLGTMNLQGTALKTLIAAKTEISLLFEVTCYHAGQGPITAAAVKCTMINDLWRGTEDTPLEDDTPDEWLEARRPAPIVRTAAQGPPVNEGWGERYRIDLTGIIVDTAGTAFFDFSTSYEETYQVTLVVGETAAALGAKLVAAMVADADLIADFKVSMDGTDLLVEYRSHAAPPVPGDFMLTAGTCAFDGGPFNWSDPVDVVASGVITGSTIATALDQACIVGDVRQNHLLYRAVQIEPTQWQLVTANVIPDSDNAGEFIQVTFVGGAFTPVAYPLS